MVILDVFLGMPQFIWEGIFSVLNVLVPGVTMALFAVYYQNRRKREIKIEGKVCMMRVDAYEQILSAFFEVQYLKESSKAEGRKADSIFHFLPIQTFHSEYPQAFQNERLFDEYYAKLVKIQHDCQIYLDHKSSRQLDRSLAIYTHFKQFLDAFSDTERDKRFGFNVKQATEHIDWAYRLWGMAMFSHCTRAYMELDKIIMKQINRLSITYRRHRLQKLLSSVRDHVLHFLDIHANLTSHFGRFCHKVIYKMMSRGDQNMMDIMSVLPLALRYVHFSDSYNVHEYFEGKRVPSDKENQLYSLIFLSQVHRS